jgi:DNA modification methylase
MAAKTIRKSAGAKSTASKRPAARPEPKQFSISELVNQLNSFSVDNYWDLGKFLVDKVMPAARKQGMFEDQVMKMISSHPGVKFPFSMLKQCQQYYAYYPDVKKRSLPEEFYFDLATKVDYSKHRDQYERMAVDFRWTISDLRKKIHDDEAARRIDERTKYGFDLRDRNVWTFETPDPRFGKPNFKGRLPGQIVANAMYYYTKSGDRVIDPFAGSGTLGDVIEFVPYFSDRKCKMYDLNPIDERITRNNVTLTGIPEESGSADYVFIDPPEEFIQKDTSTDYEVTPGAAKADFVLKFKGIARECARVLKAGGKVSVIVESATVGSEFLDFPTEVSQLLKDLGFKQVGKVYLPRRTGESATKASRGVSDIKGTRLLSSDCRELLTFQKG